MERSSFFNAELIGETYDRVYTAEDFARYFASFIGNGVYINSASNLQVIGTEDSMTIRINPGKAWINGYFYENTEDLLLNVDVADGTLSRIDRIVVRLDYVGRIITIIIKKGNLSSSPVAPALQRDVNAYEIALADVRINAGVISINQSAITDVRYNKDLCGLVSGVVDQIDTTNLFNQFQTTFDVWFEHVKGQLSEDAAGNLQLQINEINANKRENLKPTSSNRWQGTPLVREDGVTEIGKVLDFYATSDAGFNTLDFTRFTAEPNKQSLSLLGSLTPERSDIFNLGSNEYRWSRGYFDTLHTLTVNSNRYNISANGYLSPTTLAMDTQDYKLLLNASPRKPILHFQDDANVGHIPTFRPEGNGFYLGHAHHKWGVIYAQNGVINTSDEQYKSDIKDIDDELFFNMIKGVAVQTYMLNDEKVNVFNSLSRQTGPQEKKHLGIIAQDMARFEGSEFILNYDKETGYSVNNYNFTSAVMAALKVEITKREETDAKFKVLEHRVTKLEKMLIENIHEVGATLS